MYVIQPFDRSALPVSIVHCLYFGEKLSLFQHMISFSLSFFFSLFIDIHNVLVSSHFYWTASHAIGSYSAVSSRTNTPNPFSGQQQQQQAQQQLSQQINRNEEFAGI